MVSIVMGAFNEESSIAKAIESISTQTYKSWEFIIIDDCSSDKTQEIIKRYCDKDNRIRLVINSKNLGLAASLNKGISLANGIYIARMDADDISLPDRLKKQVEALDTNKEIMVIGTGAYYLNKNKKVKKIINMPESNKNISKSIFKTSPFIHPTVMIRRKFLEITQGYNPALKRAQDYDLWLRGRHIGEYHNLQEPLILYLDNNKKLFTGYYNTVLIRFKNSKNIYDFFKSLYWSLYETIFILYIFFIQIFKKKG